MNKDVDDRWMPCSKLAIETASQASRAECTLNEKQSPFEIDIKQLLHAIDFKITIRTEWAWLKKALGEWLGDRKIDVAPNDSLHTFQIWFTSTVNDNEYDNGWSVWVTKIKTNVEDLYAFWQRLTTKVQIQGRRQKSPERSRAKI